MRKQGDAPNLDTPWAATRTSRMIHFAEWAAHWAVYYDSADAYEFIRHNLCQVNYSRPPVIGA